MRNQEIVEIRRLLDEMVDHYEDYYGDSYSRNITDQIKDVLISLEENLSNTQDLKYKISDLETDVNNLQIEADDLADEVEDLEDRLKDLQDLECSDIPRPKTLDDQYKYEAISEYWDKYKGEDFERHLAEGNPESGHIYYHASILYDIMEQQINKQIPAPLREDEFNDKTSL